MTKLFAYELADLKLVRVGGQDAIKVLNGLCTAKLAELKAGHATEAMFTDDRGRVLAHTMVGLAPDQSAVWLVGLDWAADKLAAHIDRFIFREDAQPKDVSNQWLGLLLDVGSNQPAASADEQFLSKLLGQSQDSGCCSLTLSDQPAWLIRLPMIDATSHVLLFAASARDSVTEWLKQSGIALGSPAELEDRRIRNFWPRAASEMNERTLPQELDRDQLAVSFTKGCYLGQETVARLDAMGEVQKKLCLVELYGWSEDLVNMPLVREGKEVGKLNSVSPLQHGDKRYALATMRRGSMAPGSSFAIGDTTAGDKVVATGAVIQHP